MGKFIDLTGKRFGRLTVIKRADDYMQPNGRKRIMWLCKCDCGNTITVYGDNLRTKHTQSCGCLAAEITSKISRKYNEYDLSRNYGIGYTLKGEEFYFDLEDCDKIKDYCWHKDANGYISTNIWENKTNNKILMHRLIMGFLDCDIDHKHGKSTKNDNRKENLRICTHSQNLMNVGLRANNISGVTGVCFENDTNKWCATIKVLGKNIRLGRFDNFDDAVAARKKAEEEYFGEWSYNNSQTS